MKVQDDDLSKANVKLAKGIAATRKLDRLLMETEKVYFILIVIMSYYI